MGSETSIAPRIIEPDIARGIWGARRVSLPGLQNQTLREEYGERDGYRSSYLRMQNSPGNMGSEMSIAPRITKPNIARGIWGARRVSLLVFENAEQPREYR